MPKERHAACSGCRSRSVQWRVLVDHRERRGIRGAGWCADSGGDGVSNVQKIFYDLPTVADVLSGAFYHCFYCSFRCVFFRPTLKPILGAKLSENRRDPSRHRVRTLRRDDALYRVRSAHYAEDVRGRYL